YVVRPPVGAEDLLHLVAVPQRPQPFLHGLAEDVLGVLVVAHQKARVGPREPLVARDDVGRDLLVGRTQMRTAIDVVDSRCDEEATHGDSTSLTPDTLQTTHLSEAAVPRV